ncbi:MAG: acyl-CoA reductase [Candidatus Halalkalibacterium sp. M3_1C_030]
MNDLQSRIDTLVEVFDNWLTDENQFLREAIARTVEEDYFAFHDIKYSLNALKDTLNRTAMEEWVKRSELSDERDARDNNVLCLHAGNLPLVGFQDALAVLLSGARYTGKISRKDPYLLPTFLNEVKKTGIWSSIDVQWSHRIDDLEDMQNDAILFAGSEESVPGVMKSIESYNLKKTDARFLIRTAHFSMAYLDTKKEKHMKDLTEAIFRYGGKGCRSVAIVVAPYSLDEIKCEFTDYIESFWLDNPQHEKPEPKLKQRFAYNKAIESPQAWLDVFLLQEEGLEMDQDFICYWIQGDEQKASEIAGQFNEELQSIYVTHLEITIPGFEDKVEFLSDAQKPPIYWKPDGTDILEWIINKD